MSKIKKFLFAILKKSLSVTSKMGITAKTPGAAFVYKFLYKSFWPYANIIEVQGSKMHINMEEEFYPLRKTFESYADKRIHEEATTKIFSETLKPGNTFLDIGANIGYFTLLGSKLVGSGGKVYSFEPEPRNFKYLLKNIGINNYSQAEAHQKAVSNENGKIKLFVCDYDTGHHTINKKDGIEAYSKGRETGSAEPIEIEAVILDNFFKGRENAIDVIKMDVEGAEYLALSGMDNILRTNQKVKMFIEFFPLLIEKMGCSPEGFINRLIDDYKFSLYVIPDDYEGLKEMKKINSSGEIMALRKNIEDHFNLFAKK